MKGDIPGLTFERFALCFAVVTTIFLAFWFISCWWGMRRERPDWYWLALLVVALEVPYLFYLSFWKRPYYMVAGSDQLGYMALVRSMAEGHRLSDGIYSGYPTHYPPLHFLFRAVLLRISHLPLLTFFLIEPVISILLVCLAAYAVGRQVRDGLTGVLFAFMYFIIGFWGSAYYVGGLRASAGIDYAIFVPREALGGMAVISVLFLFTRARKWDWLWAGLLGGVVVLLAAQFAAYWAIPIWLFSLWKLLRTRDLVAYILKPALASAVAIAVSSPYTVPYLLSVARNGSDNYHWTWTLLSNFDPTLATVGLGLFGLTFFLGMLGLFHLRKSDFGAMLVSAALSLFVLRFHVYITKPLFNMSFVPDHAYYGLVILLSFTGALLLRDFPFDMRFGHWRLAHLQVGYLFLAFTFAVPIFAWNPINHSAMYEAFQPLPEEIQAVAGAIEAQTVPADVILATNEASPWIPVLTGRKMALASDPWLSNPTARYSLRYQDFWQAFLSEDPAEVRQLLNKWQVDILLFAKEEEEWYFAASRPENSLFASGGTRREKVESSGFKDSLRFEQVFEDSSYVMLRVKR